jgi:phospholipid/cholesterol/gamma-HCH transport system substrate-binding protein
MKRSGRVAWGEVRVGLVIIFGFSVVMWAAFTGSGMSIFKKSDHLEALFDDVSGLTTGSPVWLGGIEVGNVSDIKFIEENGKSGVRVTMAIKDDAWRMVSKHSQVSVATMGLMGDKYVTLSTRQPGDLQAEPGDVLPTRVADDMTSVFASVPDLMKNLTETTTRLNAILARVERGEGFLGRMTTSGESSDEIDSLVASSRRLMAGLNDSQKHLIHSVDAAQASFDSLSNGILHGGGTLSRLVWDSTLYTELTAMTRRMNSLATRLDSDSGTLGKLTTDSTMYVEIRRLVTETRTLLDDLRANPKKYFKFSVF